jgi:hypothetical protein
MALRSAPCCLPLSALLSASCGLARRPRSAAVQAAHEAQTRASQAVLRSAAALPSVRSTLRSAVCASAAGRATAKRTSGVDSCRLPIDASTVTGPTRRPRSGEARASAPRWHACSRSATTSATAPGQAQLTSMSEAWLQSCGTAREPKTVSWQPASGRSASSSAASAARVSRSHSAHTCACASWPAEAAPGGGGDGGSSSGTPSASAAPAASRAGAASASALRTAAAQSAQPARCASAAARAAGGAAAASCCSSAALEREREHSARVARQRLGAAPRHRAQREREVPPELLAKAAQLEADLVAMEALAEEMRVALADALEGKSAKKDRKSQARAGAGGAKGHAQPPAVDASSYVKLSSLNVVRSSVVLVR